MNNIRTYADDFLEFFHQRYKLKNKPQINFQDDIENSKNPLGKTAYYDPTEQSITVFTTGRHIKDCLRSLAHELVHHMQNERGDFDDCGPTFPGYAQKDPHLRKMESEANEKGSMCLRDWEDNLKTTNKQLYETIYKTNIKGDAKMSIKEWMNKEMSETLMEKWGYTPKKGSFLTEGMGSYDLSNSAYATGELEETPENLEEEELGEELEAHPHAPEARIEEKEELEEERNWGKNKHKYKREEEDGVEHKAGDVDGHYKDYEVEYGGNEDEKSATHPGKEDYTPENREKMSEEKLREIIKNVIKEIAAE
jgi:hypothetical protein